GAGGRDADHPGRADELIRVRISGFGIREGWSVRAWLFPITNHQSPWRAKLAASAAPANATRRGMSLVVFAEQLLRLGARQCFHALELALDRARAHAGGLDAVLHGVQLPVRLFQHAGELAELGLHRAQQL